MQRDQVVCANCKYYDDIMLTNECENCSLKRSKKGETIKFEAK